MNRGTCALCGADRPLANLMFYRGKPTCPRCVYSEDEQLLATRRVEEPEFVPLTERPPTWGKVTARNEALGLTVIEGTESEAKDVRARKARKRKDSTR